MSVLYLHDLKVRITSMNKIMYALMNYQIKKFSEKQVELSIGSNILLEKDILYLNDNTKEHSLDYMSPLNCALIDKLPLIINIHGGGFCTGDKCINSYYAASLVEMGYQVVVLNYQLAPAANLKMQVQDVINGICYAVKHYNHRSGLFLTADSSGAYLTTLICCIWNDVTLQKIYDVIIPDCIITAVGLTGTPNTIDIYPHLLKSFKNDNRRVLLNQCSEIKNYIEIKKIWNEKVPPLFLMSCKDDTFYKNVLQFDAWLTSIGAKHDSYYCDRVKGKKLFHCFNVIRPDWELSIEMNKKNCHFITELIKK